MKNAERLLHALDEAKKPISQKDVIRLSGMNRNSVYSGLASLIRQSYVTKNMKEPKRKIPRKGHNGSGTTFLYALTPLGHQAMFNDTFVRLDPVNTSANTMLNTLALDFFKITTDRKYKTYG